MIEIQNFGWDVCWVEKLMGESGSKKEVIAELDELGEGAFVKRCSAFPVRGDTNRCEEGVS